MANLTISDTLKFADLQMAAEAFIRDPDTLVLNGSGDALKTALIAGNNRASRFTEEQASAFKDQWDVLDQSINTATGFSGTLFKARKDNEALGIKKDDLVISFRSTEFVDDAVRDSLATNELEIKDTGFAWGQIADMQAWYADLKNLPELNAGQKVDVTGYSLGGHLATVFNLLHGQADIKQVVTFNGAGVGQVKEGNTLANLLVQFNTLRTNISAVADTLGDPDLRLLYIGLAIRSYTSTTVVDQALQDLQAFYGQDPISGDGLKILAALNDIQSLIDEAKRVTTLKPGDGTNNIPKKVLPDEAVATQLNYRMAIGLVSQNTYATTLAQDLARAYGSKVDLTQDEIKRFRPDALKELADQFDIVAAPQPSAVAHSQWHIGKEQRIFIEDQPLLRGGMLLSTISFNGVQLLQDGFENKNFGDTHSLVLLVDSLNVQNTLLQLVKWTTEEERSQAETTLNQILKAASYREMQNGDMAFGSGQGKAEGDVLENTLNALADLVLGPQAAKDKRLKGSLDGNTWAKDSKDLGPYTGRDTFYKTLDDILKSDAFKSDGLLGKLSLKVANADLAGAAHNDFGAFAALYSLSPFDEQEEQLQDLKAINQPHWSIAA